MGIFVCIFDNDLVEARHSCWLSKSNSPFFCPSEADLRIGEVHWGDSGVYMCKVVISDDLEGQNEASVELLVLGKL